MSSSSWHFWIDRGGTFTDVIGRGPNGQLHTLKLLSDNPGHYADAAAEGIRRVLAATVGVQTAAEIRMGTTVATNALLEGSGARTGLLITRGFGDALRIGYQNRPGIFDLAIETREPLYECVAEVDERIDASGDILETLDEHGLRNTLAEWLNAGIESIAVCLLHAWRNPVHEQRVASIAAGFGFRQISASHETSPLIKLVSRGETTVADAYLSPVLLHYVRNFRQALAAAGIDCPRVLFMQSNGGLVTDELFRGKDSVLSGPAGGVVGMAAAAKRAGYEQLIGFDMGGTSTDVSLYAGQPEIDTETQIAGIFLRTPMIRMHTIAAGGGSRLKFAGGRFQVGPESAGADPGPLSYGRGGPLTVTDANLLLGRIQAAHFPRTFGPEADQPLDRAAVAEAFAALAGEISRSSGRHYTAWEAAEGFLRVATDNMANAVHQISVQRGLDPSEFTLCCFGGAGGQHACRVADQLGMRRILLDPLAGVLSAWGMGAAALRAYRQQTVGEILDDTTTARLQPLIDRLQQECADELLRQASGPQAIHASVWLEIRESGSDTAITLPLADTASMRADFAASHQARYGFVVETPTLVIDAMRVEAEIRAAAPGGWTPDQAAEIGEIPLQETAQMHLEGVLRDVPVYRRERLRAGMRLCGPAIIAEQTGTIVVEPEWAAEVNEHLQLILSRASAADLQREIGIALDPVMLEIFSNQFMHIASEMGVVLQNTARSVNIKERLDFSCALFDAGGNLIANAPHIPVHLGSMDDSIKALLEQEAPGLAAGNVYLCNAPYNGGTHLPDLTVVSPLRDSAGNVLYLLASRAHHADIGGISPGSMPAMSSHIDEEGILFDNFLLMADGRFRTDTLREKLLDNPWPARNPEQNIADCKAQVAANERGRVLLEVLLQRYGQGTVQAYVDYVLDNAEEATRRVISTLATPERPNPCRFEYAFDNGQVIRVEISLDAETRSARIDFGGTSAAQKNNLNAPASVCRAAAMYVFRTLVSADIPLNAGCHRPLELVIPEGCMLNPRYPAAVVGGNVETSQCITDALYGALGVLAAAQGTMNNLSFGNAEFQYYETICGGAGAGPEFDGASAVQTHMTNSRMTDTEVLEVRYPILVRQFSIRPNSGGDGQHRGGDGVIRALEFRAPMSAAILSNHRKVAPFGLFGGSNGRVGVNRVERSNGITEELDGIVATQLAKGDVLVIETPGGGGYGTVQGDV